MTGQFLMPFKKLPWIRAAIIGQPPSLKPPFQLLGETLNTATDRLQVIACPSHCDDHIVRDPKEKVLRYGWGEGVGRQPSGSERTSLSVGGPRRVPVHMSGPEIRAEFSLLREIYMAESLRPNQLKQFPSSWQFPLRQIPRRSRPLSAPTCPKCPSCMTTRTCSFFAPGPLLVGIRRTAHGKGLSRRVQPDLFRGVFANILRVSKGPRLTRRRLHNTVRKTILSYYSEEEAAKIAKAAKKQRVTISNFVASAALREADLVTSKADKRQ